MDIEFSEYSLVDLYEVTNGLNKNKREFGYGHPFLTFKEVFGDFFLPEILDNLVNSTEKEQERCSIRKGDLFITRTSEKQDELGFSCVALKDYPKATFNGFTKRLRPKKGAPVDPKFMAFYMRSPMVRWQFKAFVNMSTRASLNNEMLSQIRLKLPNLQMQKKISRLLFVLNDKIKINEMMNNTLEEMARALFRDWFIDFGPTRRQMDGATDPAAIMGHAFPNAKAAALAPLFPARLGEDGLPERWLFSDVGSEFDVVMGQSPPGDTYNEAGHGLPFFQGRRDFGFRFPSRRVYCTTPKRVSGHDWTLLSVRAPVGDINRAAEMCAIGRGVGAFLHKDILHSFTYYTGLALRTELQSYDKDGTVFGSINQKQFKSLKVVRPTDGLAVSFDQIIQPVDEKIRANTEENQTLAEIRDLLLPKLMSGEIQLKDAPMVQGTLDGNSQEP